MADIATVRSALSDLYAKREASPLLAQALGMRPIPHPVNLAAGNNATADLLSGTVSEFYRIGEASFGGPSVGLYLALADNWDRRSAQRDPARRRSPARWWRTSDRMVAG